MLPRKYSYFANDWSILCAFLRSDRPYLLRLHSVSLPSFAWQTVVFLCPFFSRNRKEMAEMTMQKREVNSTWARVRDDVDIDDLIFQYEDYHTTEGDRHSDR